VASVPYAEVARMAYRPK
jgi:mannose-6-phosphate isomerase-like protein (cupin superfamily)